MPRQLWITAPVGAGDLLWPAVLRTSHAPDNGPTGTSMTWSPGAQQLSLSARLSRCQGVRAGSAIAAFEFLACADALEVNDAVHGQDAVKMVELMLEQLR